MNPIAIALAVTGMLVTPSLLGAEKEKSFVGTVDLIFRACAEAAKKNYTIETINKDELLVTFRTGVSLASWGMRVTAIVIDEGGGKARVSIRPAETGNQVFAWGAGGRITNKFFTQVEQELKVLQQEPGHSTEAQSSICKTVAAKTTVETDAGKGALSVDSVPDGAEIELDGNFVGNTPATLKLKAGKHMLRLQKGTLVWEREIMVLVDGSASVKAELGQAPQSLKQ